MGQLAVPASVSRVFYTANADERRVVVFHKKLPGPGPRVRRSAFEVARELQCDLQDVLDILHDLGEYVPSPRKKNLEEPTVRAIYDRFGQVVPDQPPRPISRWRTRPPVGAAPERSRPSVEIEDNPRGPRTYTTKQVSLGLGIESEDAVGAWAFEEWKLYGFSEVDRDV